MNSKSKYISLIFTTLLVAIVVEIIYLKNYYIVNDIVKRNQFVKIIGLPDLAFSTEVSYIRHRTLNSVFELYNIDGGLREYSKVSFSTSVHTQKSVNE